MNSEQDPTLKAAMEALGWGKFCRPENQVADLNTRARVDKPLKPTDPIVAQALNSTVSFSPDSEPTRHYSDQDFGLAKSPSEKKFPDSYASLMKRKPRYR